MSLWNKPVEEYRIPMINTNSKLHIKVYLLYKYQIQASGYYSQEFQIHNNLN